MISRIFKNLNQDIFCLRKSLISIADRNELIVDSDKTKADFSSSPISFSAKMTWEVPINIRALNTLYADEKELQIQFMLSTEIPQLTAKDKFS